MSEELDELASAYTDGEATPEEVARIESTPELLGLVDELRSVRASSLALPDPDPEVKERHLAAALEAFDELQTSRPSTLSVVTSPLAALEQDDIDEVADVGAGGGGDRDETVVASLEERRKRRMPPAWMLNAAAAIVVVGGVGFALTQLPSSSDDGAGDAMDFREVDGDSPTAASATNSATSTTAALELEELVSADEAASAGAEEAADDAMSDQDGEADAMEGGDTQASSDDEEDVATEAAPAVSLFAVADGTTATETLTQFDEMFGDELLLSPPHSCQDIIDALVNPSTGVMLGYVTIDYAGAPVDLVVFDTSGERGALLVDPDCRVISSQ